jgi:hypothetical protein
MPKRFSIRAMLVGMALVAVAIAVVREWLILKHARGEFQYARARWNAGLVTVESYIAASERLMAVEADVPWISREAAGSRHVEALKQLLRYMESGFCEWHPDTIDRLTDFIHREIQRYDSSPVLAEHR